MLRLVGRKVFTEASCERCALRSMEAVLVTGADIGRAMRGLQSSDILTLRLRHPLKEA